MYGYQDQKSAAASERLSWNEIQRQQVGLGLSRSEISSMYWKQNDGGQNQASSNKNEDQKSTNPEIHNAEGLRYLSIGENSKALDCFSVALKLNPNLFSALGHKGTVLLNLGRNAEALAFLDAALKIAPNVDIYLNKGTALDALGHHAEAVACYEAILKIDPNNAHAHFKKGFSLLALGRYAEAVVSCDASLKLNPNNGAAHNNKAGALINLGRYSEALVTCDFSLKLDSKNANNLSNKGVVLIELGRHAEALAYFNAALELDSGDDYTYSQKGHALAGLGRHVEALTIFDAALKINSNNTKAYNGKANTLYCLNRWAEARENFERVLQLKPLQSVLNSLIRYKKLHPEYLLPEEGKQLAQAAIEKIEKEAKEKAEAETALKAEHNAKLKAEQDAKEKAEKEKAEQDKLIARDQKLADKDKELADLRARLQQLELQQNKPAAPASGLSVSFEIPYNELQYGNKLGAGGFGIVYKGTWRFQHVAIKELLDEKPSSAAAADFKNEMQVMAKLRSSNVVQFYGCVLGNPKYCIVMEYMPKGSLFNLLRSEQTLDWSTRYKMSLDMACGLAFLHAENILHRDLKSLNVLLDEHYHAKLTDFGLSKLKTETKTTTKTQQSVGSEGWIAPELTDPDGKDSQKSDVFSMGITMWEIASRKIPYETAKSRAMIPFWMAQGKREEIPTDCPPKMAHLIKWCWDTDPIKRPTAAEAVKYLRDAESDFKPTDNKPNQNANAAQVNNVASGSFAASYQMNTPVMKK